MNPWEKACREFLLGCSVAIRGIDPPEDCPECLSAFCNHLRLLEQENTTDTYQTHLVNNDFLLSETHKNLQKAGEIYLEELEFALAEKLKCYSIEEIKERGFQIYNTSNRSITYYFDDKPFLITRCFIVGMDLKMQIEYI